MSFESSNENCKQTSRSYLLRLAASIMTGVVFAYRQALAKHRPGRLSLPIIMYRQMK